MRQHRNTVKPILIIIIILSTGAAIGVVADWVTNDDLQTSEAFLNEDQSIDNNVVSQTESFSPITSNNNINTHGSGLEMAWETAIGSPDAPVIIIEYGTYGCQICRQVHQNGIIDQLIVDYADNIAYVYVNWPIYHPNDVLATEAVFCAQEQGKEVFWLYHNALYDLTYSDYDSFDQQEDFVTLAEQINIDAPALDLCLAEGKFREYVYELSAQGYELDLPGTPTFFVNGMLTRTNDIETQVVAILGEK